MDKGICYQFTQTQKNLPDGIKLNYHQNNLKLTKFHLYY